MKNESFNTYITFRSEKIVTQVILESSFTNKVRILLKDRQVIKEHKTSSPLIGHFLKGKLIWRVNENQQHLKKANTIALARRISPNLIATKNSVIHLS